MVTGIIVKEAICLYFYKTMSKKKLHIRLYSIAAIALLTGLLSTAGFAHRVESFKRPTLKTERVANFETEQQFASYKKAAINRNYALFTCSLVNLEYTLSILDDRISILSHHQNELFIYSAHDYHTQFISVSSTIPFADSLFDNIG